MMMSIPIPMILTNARSMLAAKHRTMKNWVLVMELFSVGSTRAWEICDSYGIDGDSIAVNPYAELISPPVDEAKEKVEATAKGYMHALEQIAVGDAKDPRAHAESALVESGHWTSGIAAGERIEREEEQQVEPDVEKWVLELRPAFAGHPEFPPTYYAGWFERASDAARTFDVFMTPKFNSKDEAVAVAAKMMNTISCTWQAVPYSFARENHENKLRTLMEDVSDASTDLQKAIGDDASKEWLIGFLTQYPFRNKEISE